MTYLHNAKDPQVESEPNSNDGQFELRPTPSKYRGDGDKVVAKFSGLGGILHVALGYNDGSRPRAGTRVTYRSRGRFIRATVLATYKIRSALVIDDDGHLDTVSLEDLLSFDGERLPLRKVVEILDKHSSFSSNKHQFVLWALIAHFSGANGEQYRSPAVLAWLSLAVAKSMRLDEGLHVPIDAWCRGINKEVKESGGDLSLLPAEFREVDGSHEKVINFGETAEDTEYPSSEDKLRRAKELAGAYLEQIEDVLPLQTDLAAFEPGALAYDLSEMGDDAEVVVLGPVFLVKDPYLFHVLDQDTGETMVRHAEDLELTGEALPLDDADLVADLYMAANDNDLVAVWFLLNHHYAFDDPQTATSRVLLAACLYRTSTSAGNQFSSLAKRVCKMMMDAYRDVPKEDRGKLNALIPELVNPKARKQLQSFGNVKQLVSAWSQLNPIPMEEEGDDVIHGPDLVNVSVPAASMSEQTRTVDKLQPKAAPRPPAPKTAQPLRFNVTETVLLAMEWQLPGTPEAYERAIATSIEWMSQRLGTTLPARWNRGSHEIELSAVRLQVEADRAVFAMRLDHPDVQIHTRSWRLECSILQGQGGVGGMVGLRLTALDRAAQAKPVTGVPGLVRALAKSPGLVLGDGCTNTPLEIRSHKDTFTLRRSIEDTGRDFPVWVVALDVVAERQADDVATYQLAGLCNNQRADYERRYWTLAAGTAHVFAPGQFKPTVVGLLDQAALATAKAEALALRQRPATPSFKQVRDLIRESASVAPAPAVSDKPADDAEPLETSPPSFQQRDLEQLLDIAIGERQIVSRELQEAQAEITSLRSKLHALQGSVDDAPGDELPTAPLVFPDSLVELPDWAPSIASRVVFADKALRIASRTQHSEVAKIYGILQALHDHYWPMRWGDDPEARQRWLDFLVANRLKYGNVGHALDNQHYSSAYKAQFGRQTHEMTLHVQGSSSRDPMRCIRVYFQPDDERRQVLIGHLPSHLDNTHS